LPQGSAPPPKSTPPASEKPNLFLLEQIWRNQRLLDALCDPRRFETHAAMAVARQMKERYRDFETRLVTELMALPEVAAGKDRRIERCLQILDAVSSGRRIIMPLMRLMNSENQRIRSKVARILGRLADNASWTRKVLAEVDPRTRANIIESLWGNDSPEIREVLWQATEDGNNRVRGNAILGLYQLGVASVLPAIRVLAENETANCRATAAWLMGATGDPRFRGMVKKLRADPVPSVRAAALRALVQLNKTERTDSPNLEPLVRFSEAAEGVRRVGFELPEDAADSRVLLATDVVLAQNGELIWDYSFVERRLGPVSALFVLFDGPESGRLPDLKDAFQVCLEQKESNDRWSVVRMAAGPDSDFDELASVPPPYQGPELKKAITRFEQLRRIPTDQLPKLVRLVGTHGPGRHVVLFLSPSALSDADLESLEVAAVALQFNVDVVSFSTGQNERLQKLARKTNGIFLVAPEDGVSALWMVQMYTSLAHRYEVSYPLSGPSEMPLDITILPPRKAGPIRNAG